VAGLAHGLGDQGVILEALDGDDFTAEPLLAAEIAEYRLEHGNFIRVTVADVRQGMGHD
jgi:hypothetical protein